VTLVADAAPLIALADEIDPRRSEIAAVLEAERGDIILPAFVAAEVDYLVGRRTGRSARRAFLLDLANRRFRVECLLPMEYEMILQLDQQYADLDVGLADLSVVVLARRFGTRRILTFDERHFRTLRPLDGGMFTSLPADEQRAPH
jgi:predicted nucleic acid-binding protein